ncbi:glycine betaine ABC transporter substrate-binding protein [Halalkalibacter alkaliphilus]|uniref:Glycine betaine ABC transporter substrate-binding protein n=1 Tax=Halalkalibacter alkaliphilus TaxID=2917993 RepID=A0A9X2I6L4_9BACI|nr:glycine betaine ABC transporter substrate-binding protein [Halalkalibacter alkaliphilus]MCL7748987.1 glycine betaine ABC transporter substrate-binding protein [Halalkalibacter alkaliphilus]
MKKFLLGSMMAVFLATAVGCASGETSGETTEENSNGETITFGVTPWTSTVPPTQIASLILQDMGYEVVETNADVGNVFMGLSRGDLDVFMDAWFPMHQVHMERFEDTVVDTAVSYPEAETGWVVPNYMEDINSVEDIVGNEDLFNNEMYGIEEGTSAQEETNEMIEALGLDITQVNSSEGGMLAQAQRQMQQEEPVIFFGWRPHTMFNKYDIKVIGNDAGFFETSSVHVVTNHELQEKAPDAFEFLSNWNISIDDVEEMIVQIEDEGQDPEEAAREWIDNNQDKVNEMLGN